MELARVASLDERVSGALSMQRACFVAVLNAIFRRAVADSALIKLKRLFAQRLCGRSGQSRRVMQETTVLRICITGALDGRV